MTASKRGHVLKNAVGESGSQTIQSAVTDAQTQIQAGKAQNAAVKAAQRRVGQVSKNRATVAKTGAAVLGGAGILGAISKGKNVTDALSGR